MTVKETNDVVRNAVAFL